MARTWRYYCTDCPAEETVTFERIEDEHEPTVAWVRKHGNGARFTPAEPPPAARGAFEDVTHDWVRCTTCRQRVVRGDEHLHDCSKAAPNASPSLPSPNPGEQK